MSNGERFVIFLTNPTDLENPIYVNNIYKFKGSLEEARNFATAHNFVGVCLAVRNKGRLTFKNL